jgi:hypothetical protein
VIRKRPEIQSRDIFMDASLGTTQNNIKRGYGKRAEKLKQD